MRKSLLFVALIILLAGCQQAKSSIGKLQIMDQKIQVDSLKLEKPGYVLIRELTADDQVGAAVGLSPMAPLGETKNLLIAVPNMKANTSYRVSLRIDNGDLLFIASEDSPALKGKKEIYKDIKNP